MTFDEARARFPILERVAYLNAGTFGPLAQATIPTVFHIPPRVAGFIGRAAELEEIRRRLENERQLVLSGMAGIGKTALAVEHAHRSYATYDVACLLDASSPPTLSIRSGWVETWRWK